MRMTVYNHGWEDREREPVTVVLLSWYTNVFLNLMHLPKAIDKCYSKTWL